MATLSLAHHMAEPARVQGIGRYLHVSFGNTILTITRQEGAHLAADLLSALGMQSLEIVDNALPPAVEAAIVRGRGA